MSTKRIMAARTGQGKLVVIEGDIPPLSPGMVLVEVHNSVISPGTELNSWCGLYEELQNPKPLPKPIPFGYGNAGIVRSLGEDVTRFKVGDRVVCIGAGYALHADYAVVPHNLCTKLPDGVSFLQGSYGMLAATALHTLRRGEPEFGENVLIVGLGIVGQLTAQLYQLAGSFAMGWDYIDNRVEIAGKWGIHGAVCLDDADHQEATKAFTHGSGFDAAIMAFGGEGTDTFKSVLKVLKRSPDGHTMGRIVINGNLTFTYSGLNNVDVRRAARTGPGYHDSNWEVGSPYPPVFMRWTTTTNLDLCMRLLEEGKLDVDALTTHRIPLHDLEAGITQIIEEPNNILGVVLDIKH